MVFADKVSQSFYALVFDFGKEVSNFQLLMCNGAIIELSGEFHRWDIGNSRKQGRGQEIQNWVFDIVGRNLEKENDIFGYKFGNDSDWICGEHFVHSLCMHKAHLGSNSIERVETVLFQGSQI